jgi:hypothetical protein
MQDFIDIYKETFKIEKDVKLDESLNEGDVKVTEETYFINASKDPVVLESLGKIKLHTMINDERVFKPTTELMQTLMSAWIFKIMANQLEIVEMDLLLEKFLIDNEKDPYKSYAVLKALGAEPTLSGADSSQIDGFIMLDPTPALLDELERIEKEGE